MFKCSVYKNQIERRSLRDRLYLFFSFQEINLPSRNKRKSIQQNKSEPVRVRFYVFLCLFLLLTQDMLTSAEAEIDEYTRSLEIF